MATAYCYEGIPAHTAEIFGFNFQYADALSSVYENL